MLEFSSTNNDCGCDSGSLNGFTDPSCPAPSVVTWQSLQGKPSCFTPCAHTHVPGDIIGLDNYIQTVTFANSITNTNSIQLTAPSGVLNANLKLSSNAGTGYKVPLSILSDGLIGQIPYASGSTSGILNTTDWNTFNNKFNTPSGTIYQYVRGDGSLATFPLVVLTSRSINTASPLTGGGDLTADRTISMPSANSTTSGYLLYTDWIIFNNKFTLPSLTNGSVLFSNGITITQDNTNFFWDNTNKFLGLGGNTPNQRLHVKSASILDVDVSCLLETTTTGSSNSGYIWKNGNSVNLRFGGFASTYGIGTSTTHEFNEFTNNVIRRKIYSGGEMYFSSDNTTAPAGPSYDYHFKKSNGLSMVLQSTTNNPYLQLTGSTTLKITTLAANGYIQTSNLLNFSPNGLNPSLGEYAARFEANNVFSIKYGLAIDNVAYYNVAGGSSVTIANNSYGVILGAATASPMTVTLPSAPAEGQEVCIMVEEDKTLNISTGTTKVIFGKGAVAGTSISVTINISADASSVLFKYYSAGNGGLGAWYLTGF